MKFRGMIDTKCASAEMALFLEMMTNVYTALYL